MKKRKAEKKPFVPLTENDTMPYGRHKGKLMKDLPLSYKIYLRDKRYATKEVLAYIDSIEDSINKEENGYITI